MWMPFEATATIKTSSILTEYLVSPDSSGLKEDQNVRDRDLNTSKLLLRPRVIRLKSGRIALHGS